jgi:hypothetical protein
MPYSFFKCNPQVGGNWFFIFRHNRIVSDCLLLTQLHTENGEPYPYITDTTVRIRAWCRSGPNHLTCSLEIATWNLEDHQSMTDKMSQPLVCSYHNHRLAHKYKTLN